MASMNWNKRENWMMFVMTLTVIVVVEPLFVLCSPAVASTTPPDDLRRYAEYLSHLVQAPKVTCPDDWKLSANLEEPNCYKYVSDELSFTDAHKTCNREKAHLAVAENQQELDYLMANDWTDSDEIDFWIGYQYRQWANSSSWSEVYQSQPVDPDQAKMLEGYVISDRAHLMKTNNTVGFQKLCSLLRVNGIILSNCKDKNRFLCERDVEYTCLDRSDQVRREGERFSPKGLDKCTSCTCGKSMNCMSAMCAMPSCDHYIPDENECCKYTCIWDDENENGKTGIESNMQWMLTMAFSFFILGVVLLMIYRMRQKRMAYLRFRRERLQQLSQVEFEPGSGPPPPPDDFDGSRFHEPPPPYTFYKHLHVDLPPPYDQLTITMPTVNTNNRKIEDTGETVTLLGDSEPSTPSVQSADLTLSEPTGATTTVNRQNANRQEQDQSSQNSNVTGSQSSQESNSSTSTIFQTSV